MNVRTMTLTKQQPNTVEETHQEPSFTGLLRLEYLKASKRLMTRLVFGIMALAMGAIHFGGYLIMYVFGVGDDVELEAFLVPSIIEDGFLLNSILGPILMVVLAAGIVGSEYGWGTVRTVVGTGVNRGRLLLAKLVILVAAGILLTLTGIGVLLVSSTVISLVEGQGLGFNWVSMSKLGDLLLMIARSSFVISVIGIVLGFLPSQLARSVAAGIGAGVGTLVVSPLLYLLTGALGSAGERIEDFLIPTLGESLDRLNTFGTPTEATADVPGPWQAAATLTLYAAIAIAVSIVVFRRRDIAVS